MCGETSIQNSFVRCTICFNRHSDYEMRKMLACVASFPIRKQDFSAHHPTNFHTNQKARKSSLAEAFASRAGKLSTTLVNVDAKIHPSNQGSVKGTYEGDRKSEGKANLLTTNEILLEEVNEKFVSRPTMESAR